MPQLRALTYVFNPQEMVPHSQLHTALLQVDALQAEKDRYLSESAALKSQISTAWEKVKLSTAETAEMRSVLSSMVPRSELMDSEARYSDLHAIMVSSARKHSEAMDEVQNRVLKLESEKSTLVSAMQVNFLFLYLHGTDEKSALF
jgi:hypothetical protein